MIMIVFIKSIYPFINVPISRTDSVLVTLIMYTVNTGMLTALDAAAGMVCYAVMPTNLVFIGFYLNLSKRTDYLCSVPGTLALNQFLSISLCQLLPGVTKCPRLATDEHEELGERCLDPSLTRFTLYALFPSCDERERADYERIRLRNRFQ